VGLLDRVQTLLGVSAFTKPANDAASLGSAFVNRVREAMGGQIQPISFSQTRWYPSDLEAAELAADTGDISLAARLMTAARKDGVLAGVLSTRTDGLVRLPRVFKGMSEIIADLEVGGDTPRSTFDEMFPAAELALLAADGLLLGVGVGELVPVEGREHPVLVRLEPEFLRYRWSENRWYFRSVAGLIPITPGDGRWVLHIPGGRQAPWRNGLWRAIGRAYIRKEHAQLYKDNWEAKLANPARVAYSPTAASDEQHESWFQQVMAWGTNTVFGLKPGYEVKLLESNGRGHESFENTIKRCDEEYVICIAGQTVTTDGGTGFANAGIHDAIRSDLIQSTADGLAYTVNTQGLPVYLVEVYGEGALERGAVVAWDVTPPKDRAAEATALGQVGTALVAIGDALAKHGRELDVDAFCERFNIPVTKKKTAPVLEIARQAA
jgi:hypothetical protein